MTTELIGTKILLFVTTVDGRKRYDVNDPVKVREIEAQYPGRTVRLMVPGSAWTMELRGSRINVVIEEDGTISRIYEG